METDKKHKRPKLRHETKGTKLDAIILRKPELNFSLWDEMEIDELERTLKYFYDNRHLYSFNTDFNTNWKNCDMAIKYFHEHIQPKWEKTDPNLPLKQAIREGKVIRVHTSFSPNNRDIDLDALRKKVEDGLDELDKMEKPETLKEPYEPEYFDPLNPDHAAMAMP